MNTKSKRKVRPRYRALEPLEERTLFSVVGQAEPPDAISWNTPHEFIWFDEAPAQPDSNLSSASTALQLSEQSEEGIDGKLSVPRALLGAVSAEGYQFTRLEVPGWGNGGNIGQAELPVFRTSLVVPANVDVVPSYEVLASANFGDGYRVYPAQPPATSFAVQDGVTQKPEFAFDSDYYSGDLTLDTTILWTSDPIIAGDRHSIALELRPFQYDPASGEISVVTDLAFRLSFEETPQSPAAAEPSSDLTSPAGQADYLMITADAFYDEVLPLAQWKHRMGYKTHLAKMSDVGTTQTDVYNYIKSAYDADADKPQYVLLVGDHEDVPSYEIVGHPYYGLEHVWHSDYEYARLSGTDVLADLAVGRLPGDTESQITTMVNKILTYERTPNTDSWYDDVLFAGMFQDGDSNNAPDLVADRYFMEDIHRASDFLGPDYDFWPSDDPYNKGYTIHTDRVWDSATSNTLQYRPWDYPGRITPPDPVPDAWKFKPDENISATINNGVSIVLHRDHGNLGGWGDPEYSISDVDDLTNADRLPVVFSINCGTGWFDTVDAFGEAWMRNANGGAVAYTGAMRPSYTGPNDSLHVGIFDSMWNDYDPTWASTNYGGGWRFGDVMNYAKDRVFSGYGYSNEYSLLTARLFNVFGDPAIPLRTEIPASLTVTHPASVDAEVSTDFTVQVTRDGAPLEGGIVCISRGDSSDYWVGETDAGGNVTFAGLTTSEGGAYDIVVSHRNAIPYVGTFDSVVPEIDVLGTSFDIVPDNLFGVGVATASFQILNQGNTNTGAFDVKFYLSDDADIDPGSDTALEVDSRDPNYDSREPAAYHVDGLEAEATHSGSASLVVPAGDLFDTDNDYYIGMVVDADGDVTETDETNNRNRGQDWDRGDVFYDSTVTIYETDFAPGLPADWKVIDGGSDGKTWTDANPKGRANANWSGTFMIADSDWAGFTSMDESLVTPVFDFSGYTDAVLKFTHAFDTSRYSWWYGNGTGDVDVRVGGGPWQNVARYEDVDAEGAVELDLSSIVDGQSDVEIRWHYYDAYWDLYWGIDNVQITGTRMDYPTVVSVGREDADPTGASQVDFAVTFSENVTGVGTDDFTLWSTGGISGAQIVGVAPSSGPSASYVVTVATGSGDGTIRLDVSDNDTIVDDAGNPLGGVGTGNGDYSEGEVYTIDKTPPAVSSVVPSAASAIGPGDVDLDVTFSEVVYGVDATDLVLSGSAASGATVGTPVNMGGDTWRFPVSNLAEGKLYLTLASDADDIEDAVGNDLVKTIWGYSVVPEIDLLGTSFDIDPDNLFGAGVATASFQILNQGDNAAGPFDVKFYLSDDANIDPGRDTALEVDSSDPAYDSGEPAAYHVVGLGTGGTHSGSVSLAVPAGDPFGTDNDYYIGMVVDADGDVTETDETNNRNRGQNLDRDDVFYDSTVTIYQTDFTAGLPAGWTLIDGGSDGKTWTDANPKGRANANWSGTFMIADSDWAGFTSMDESLVTPVFDFSGYTDAVLKFTHAFDTSRYSWWYGNGTGDVDVRVGGGPWQNVARYEDVDAEGAVELDLSSIVDGQSDVEIRWHYYDAYWDLYWGIDNVQITGTRMDYPTVVSVGREDADPTGASQVDFAVTFSENVTGVGTDDFTLWSTGGISGAQIVGVAPSSGPSASYVVTVATGSGDGTIRLDVSDNDTIVDDAGNPLGGVGTGNGDYSEGEVYTIDKTPPAVSSVVPSAASAIGPGDVDLDVTFSEVVYGVDATDLVLSGSAASGATVGTPVNMGGDTWRFPVSNLAEGKLYLTLASDADDIEDAVGNDLVKTIWSYSVVPDIDLLGTSFAIDPDNLFGAGVATASFQILNQGDNTAGPFDVRFYLSDDADIDPGRDMALQLGFGDQNYDLGDPAAYHVGGLGTGATHSGSVSLVVPAGDPFGTDNDYYIGMVVDADGDVTETDETNNRNRGQDLDRDDVFYDSTVTIYQTDFSAGLPADWTVIDGRSDGKTWTDTNPRGRGNENWSGTFMIADSDWAGFTSMDESLVTPVFDFSGYTDAVLKFTHAFDTSRYSWWYGNGTGDVDVRVGGGPWQNVARYEDVDAAGAVELDLSSIVDGKSDVQIRWHYYDAYWDLYWGIDNVLITGTRMNQAPEIDAVAAGGESEITNPVNPMDVNDDGRVSPLDVLILVSHLNESGVTDLRPFSNGGEGGNSTGHYYYDVNSDLVVSPADVLGLVNHLNSFASQSAGGESESIDGAANTVVAAPIADSPAEVHELSGPITRQLALRSSPADDRGVAPPAPSFAANEHRSPVQRPGVSTLETLAGEPARLGEILTDDLAEDIVAAWEHPSAVENLLSELASIRGPVHLS